MVYYQTKMTPNFQQEHKINGIHTYIHACTQYCSLHTLRMEDVASVCAKCQDSQQAYLFLTLCMNFKPLGPAFSFCLTNILQNMMISSHRVLSSSLSCPNGVSKFQRLVRLSHMTEFRLAQQSSALVLYVCVISGRREI